LTFLSRVQLERLSVCAKKKKKKLRHLSGFADWKVGG
jgi:hypothetical protein